MTRLEISRATPFVLSGWPAVETTPPTTEEDTAEEEEDPSGEGEPDGVADRGIATSAIYPGFCEEKKRDVEDEGDHSHSCGETRYTGAATRHGHFTDVCEETEDGRSGGQDECDDVEDEAVRYPFDNYIGNLYPGGVPEQSVDI